MSRLNINDVRAEALFASPLQRSDAPTGAQVREAVRAAIRRFGARGCAARMAEAFGDSPNLAVTRMRWARHVIEEVFAASGPARCTAGSYGRAA
ncbi:MAG: hypothetical protein AUI14_00285 [Actinobacteria bacterium 13_2_20CM_2_71_6]|nr:MAG: hypothetical protein AUI14_00285 [Actinobacteria bacterium 13_2_20CM_2_71_6]